MALNGLRFPPSQPIKFYPKIVEIDNAYHTYSMDDYAMQLIQPAHFRRNAFRGDMNYYYTKVQNDQWITVIFEYALGNVGSFSLRFKDKNGNLTPVSPSLYMNQYTIAGNEWEGVALRYVQYKFKVEDIISNAQGYYQLDVIATFADGQTYEYLSEWLDVKNTHPNTILFDYFNSINDFDIYFLANPILQLRLPAYKRMGTPQFEDVTYRNQNVDLKLLSSRAYRMFDLFVGYNGGISDFHVDKLRYATQCDTLKIDKKRYIKSDNGDFSVSPIANYPLYKVEMQIEEYNPKEAGTFFEDNGLFLFSTSTSPYAITEFILSEGATDYDFLGAYTGMAVELWGEADEEAFISQLNATLTAMSLTGKFVKIGTAVYFQKDTDTLTINSVVACKKVLIIDFATTPIDTSQVISVTQGVGCSAISLYRESTTKENIAPVQRFIGNFSETIDVEDYRPSDYDGYRIYLYCNDLQTELQVSNAGKTIYNLNGGVSFNLTSAIFNGAVISDFNTYILREAAQNLETITFSDFGISTINANCYEIVTAGDWGNLINVDLALNNLLDAGQDEFYNSYHDKVYLPYSLTGGTLSTTLQTTSSLPTAASLTERTAMQADGYTLAF